MQPPKHRRRRILQADDGPVRKPLASLALSDMIIDVLEEAGCVYVDDIPAADCEVLKERIDRARFFHLRSVAKQQGVEFNCCAAA